MTTSADDLKAFETALHDEVMLILSDPLFKRSPIQSRLLQFLCDKALAGQYDLTQYIVAVDGLGRSEDFDLTNDSYPRVQISRLRNNLAAYYARQEPSSTGCVYIRSGEYRLRLGSRERAYPDNRISAAPLPDLNDAPLVAPNFSDTAPPIATATLEGNTQSGLARRSSKAIAVPNAVAAGVGLVGALGLAFALLSGSEKTAAAPLDPPVVSFKADSDLTFANSVGAPVFLSRAESIATNQLASSFVSRTGRVSASDSGGEEDGAADTDYELVLSVTMPSERPVARLQMFDKNGELIHSNLLPVTEDTEEFNRKLAANLVYITAPNGVIARDQLQEVGEAPQSAYECFITIEGKRADGEAIAPLVDDCIDRFPKDRYAAFWLARRGYAQFTKDAAAGNAVKMEGQAWTDTMRALEIDPYNAFANFVAAKVAASNGYCSEARRSVERALEQGSSFPVLIAASLVEGSGCTAEPERLAREHALTEALIENSPNPDELLHSYLILSALAIDRPDLARTMAGRIALSSKIGPSAEMLDQLRSALATPGYYERHRVRVDAAVNYYVWSKTARDKIRTGLGQVNQAASINEPSLSLASAG